MTARLLKAQGKTVQQCIAAGLAAADFRQTLVRIWYRDTFGNGWNSGTISFKDTNTNTTIITLTGPASGPKTWFYTDVLFSNGTNYSVTKIGGAYPSEIKYAVTTTDTVAYLGTETPISTTDVNCILAQQTDALSFSYPFTIPSRYYYSVAELKVAFTLQQLKAGGFTVTQLKIDFTLAQLIAEGFTLAELIAEGFTLAELRAGGVTAAELKLVFTASELKAGGFTAADLKAGGFTAAELSTIDFSALGNLQNGSFEQPQMANNSYQYISSLSTVPGWDFFAVLINNSSAWGYPKPYPAGNQAACIQGTRTFSQRISQRTNLNAGSYNVTFYACGRPSRSGSNTINVYCRQNSAGGTSEPPVLTFTPPTTAWQKYTATINIPSFGNYSLGFYGTITNGDSSTAIQDVKITPTSSALNPIYTLLELKAVYTLLELKAVYTLLELKAGGFTTTELFNSGFTSKTLFENNIDIFVMEATNQTQILDLCDNANVKKVSITQNITFNKSTKITVTSNKIFINTSNKSITLEAKS